MYDKVSTNFDFTERELKILKFWETNEIFKKSIENRQGAPVFTFYDGPPTANGKPHIGHILTRVIKDIIPRYKTMKGYKVLRKAGWDTHGLPVELEVEKDLGIDGKSQIEDYGVEPFIKQCKKSVWKYESEWKEMSERVGFWADMEDPYVTYHNEYIESVWWALKKIWDKGLMYKGHKIVPYCPRCGTSLSSHEVAQGYKDVKDPSIYVKFKSKDEDNLYFMAWTTTPWTLPSNVALAINPKENYVKIKCKEEYYILAEGLVESVIEEEFKIIETYKGSQLEGMEYEPLFDFAIPKEKAYYLVAADYVTLTDGTGIVHTAPAFGEDDAISGRKYKLPFIQLVNEQGKFVEEVTPWKGVFVKDADPEIINNLDGRNLIYKQLDYEHSYPFCWRCDTHLLYYARDTWFIEMTAVKEKLMENNMKINWLPENIRDGRFGNFIGNIIDWGISRERYWGTPLPIWECSCGHRHVIGSIAELKEMGQDVPEDIELHKPYIDKVLLRCPKCSNGKMKRVAEVIDCWFDSGAMPFAQWHYPFENEEIFNENYPADFISEAIDQTRGWFYTLLAISTLIFDEPAFKNVIVLGHVQDKDGQKMSKHKGNVINPWDILNKQGADAVRWYFYTNSAPWLPSRFYEDAVNEAQRKFMGTLWNTYAFYVLYANIDKFNPLDYKLEYNKLPIMDKWILSRLNSLIKFVDLNLNNYRISEPARAMQEFVDDLSNWYIRRSRERFWAGGMEDDKINAYMTLYTVLTTLIKVAAPFVPFITEEIYNNLVKQINSSAIESIHLTDFPLSKPEWIDKELEKNMDLVLKIVVIARSCRNLANIKNRQPIGDMYIKSDYRLNDKYESIVKEELNIKKIKFVEDIKAFTSYKLKAQLKTVGPKYGKYVSKISQFLANADGNEMMQKLEEDAEISFNIDNQIIRLSKEDLLIEIVEKEGMVAETDYNITVVLDTNLTEELIEEGFVRELISKIQTMRKEAEFEVQDYINLYYSDNARLATIIENNKENISKEVLADSLIEGQGRGYTKEWNINGEKLKMTVEKK